MNTDQVLLTGVNSASKELTFLTRELLLKVDHIEHDEETFKTFHSDLRELQKKIADFLHTYGHLQ